MNDGRDFMESLRGTAFPGSILGYQYTISDGLAGMQVEDVYQDRRGLVWIATADGGVSRFDGIRFETFGLADGLPHPTVMAIAEDKDGWLWFGTLGGGLAVFDGQGFQVYTTEHGLPSNEIVGLQPQADGSIRVLTSAGFGRFAAGQCIESTTAIEGQPIGRVYDMATDSAGRTWLATKDRGVISLDGRHLSLDERGGAFQRAWKFAQDASGWLWTAFCRGSRVALSRYDPSCQRLDLIDLSAELGEPQSKRYGARHIRIDDKGWLWVARARGLVVYDGQDWHTCWERSPGINLRDNVRLTYEDREGNIWVGLADRGLVFCDPLHLQLYTEAEGLPDRNIRCLAEDGAGRLWIGTPKGLACLENDRIRPTRTDYGICALGVDRQGTLWFGGEEGKVFKAGTDSQTIAVAAEEDTEAIGGLCQDQAGRLWVWTEQGTLGWIEEDRFVAIAQGLHRRLYQAVMPDSEGGLWIGVQGETPALYYKDKADHLSASDYTGLETVYFVNALWKHEGTLWVGAANGLFAVDCASRQVRQHIKAQDGLPVNKIRILSLAADSKGSMWIGLEGKGVLNYNGRTFHSIRLGPLKPENMVNAILCNHRGWLWFGTEGGLIRYRPRHTRPGIVIRQVVGGRLLEAPQSVSFPEGAPEIVIHFQGIRFGFGRTEQMHYSHRMVGHNPAAEWSEFTLDNKVSYYDLPVGEYHFEVRTQDRDGLVSEVAHLEVRVVPAAKSARLQSLEHKRQTSVQAVPGQSPTITKLLLQVEPVARTNMTVLLLGETGTGKNLIAREIHALSLRREHAFIPLNCGALPTELIESELFGHERGAFTGAVAQRAGYIEQAHGGTLFLDEISDLVLETQQVLLHVLDGGYLRRIGSNKSTKVDIRIIAATNRDLKKEIEEGRFRADLFYRLNVSTLVVPPLRDRRKDIPVLVEHFVRQYAQKLKRPVPSLGNGVIEHLQTHSWPGNVRELESLIQQAVALCRKQVIEVAAVPLPAENEGAEGALVPLVSASPVEQKTEAKDEKQQIIEALKTSKGRIYGEYGAAQLLGMNPERLRSRMRAHGLQRPKKASFAR